MGKEKFSIKILDAFQALSYRNFRLFWTGQLISLIGTWMQNIGQAWLVLQLTDSAFKLGVVSALQFLPLTFFSLFAGPLVDKFSKKKIIICTQFSFMFLALTLATFTAYGWIKYWHILILAVLLGLTNTIDIPARQSFVIELVGKESLMNAIALNSTVFNLGRVVGPAVAGLLIGLVGMSTCFYLNALSFIPAIIGLILIKIAPHVRGQKQKDIIGQIGEGLSYIRSKQVLLFPLLLLALMSTFTMNYNVLIPVYAKESLSMDALGLGLLMTSLGAGFLLGAIVLAANSRKGPGMKVLFGAALLASVFLIILGMERHYLLSCLTLIIIGFFSLTLIALVNTTIQLNSQDSMRGRVMSVFSLVLGGVSPIGSILAGKVADNFGAHWSISLSGVIGVLAVMIVMLAYKKSHLVK